jgi:hypothetical protein
MQNQEHNGLYLWICHCCIPKMHNIGQERIAKIKKHHISIQGGKFDGLLNLNWFLISIF